jgi:hypothetical protein
VKKALFFQSGYLAKLANSQGFLARLDGLIGKVGILMDLAQGVCEKGLFLADAPDAQDDHTLGPDGQQMIQMIRFGCFFSSMARRERRNTELAILQDRKSEKEGP